jgi:hypothetical protein
LSENESEGKFFCLDSGIANRDRHSDTMLVQKEFSPCLDWLKWVGYGRRMLGVI